MNIVMKHIIKGMTKIPQKRNEEKKKKNFFM